MTAQPRPILPHLRRVERDQEQGGTNLVMCQVLPGSLSASRPGVGAQPDVVRPFPVQLTVAGIHSDICIKNDTFVEMLPFGETVLSWRLARGMSQAVLAQAARMSRPNLSAVERGDREVTLGTLRRLALALDVLPGVLANGEPPTRMSEPLGRAALERIAHAALRGTPAGNDGEQRLGALLAEAASTRITGRDEPARAPTAKKRRSTRNAARAYLMLKSTTTPAIVASLVDRLGGGGRE